MNNGTLFVYLDLLDRDSMSLSDSSDEVKAFINARYKEAIKGTNQRSKSKCKTNCELNPPTAVIVSLSVYKPFV